MASRDNEVSARLAILRELRAAGVPTDEILGQSELAEGAEREEDPEELIRSLRAAGISEADIRGQVQALAAPRQALPRQSGGGGGGAPAVARPAARAPRHDDGFEENGRWSAQQGQGRYNSSAAAATGSATWAAPAHNGVFARLEPNGSWSTHQRRDNSSAAAAAPTAARGATGGGAARDDFFSHDDDDRGSFNQRDAAGDAARRAAASQAHAEMLISSGHFAPRDTHPLVRWSGFASHNAAASAAAAPRAAQRPILTAYMTPNRERDERARQQQAATAQFLAQERRRIQESLGRSRLELRGDAAESARVNPVENTMGAANFTLATTHENLRRRYGRMTEDMQFSILVEMETYLQKIGRPVAMRGMDHYCHLKYLNGAVNDLWGGDREVPEMLCLWWLAATDASITTSTVENRMAAFVIALENSIRGHNRDNEAGFDDGARNDRPACRYGFKNNFAESFRKSLYAVHPDNVFTPELNLVLPDDLKACLHRIYRERSPLDKARMLKAFVGVTDEDNALLDAIKLEVTPVFEKEVKKYGTPTSSAEAAKFKKQCSDTLAVMENLQIGDLNFFAKKCLFKIYSDKSDAEKRDMLFAFTPRTKPCEDPRAEAERVRLLARKKDILNQIKPLLKVALAKEMEQYGRTAADKKVLDEFVNTTLDSIDQINIASFRSNTLTNIDQDAEAKERKEKGMAAATGAATAAAAVDKASAAGGGAAKGMVSATAVVDKASPTVIRKRLSYEEREAFKQRHAKRSTLSPEEQAAMLNYQLEQSRIIESNKDLINAANRYADKKHEQSGKTGNRTAFFYEYFNAGSEQRRKDLELSLLSHDERMNPANVYADKAVKIKGGNRDVHFYAHYHAKTAAERDALDDSVRTQAEKVDEANVYADLMKARNPSGSRDAYFYSHYGAPKATRAILDASVRPPASSADAAVAAARPSP